MASSRVALHQHWKHFPSGAGIEAVDRPPPHTGVREICGARARD